MFDTKADAAAWLALVPFLEARHYRQGRRGDVRFVVVHDMEAPERSDSAEKWVQRTHTQDRVSSVNYGVDDNSLWCAVRPVDEAFHVSAFNKHTVGIEHPGYARQSTAEWLDPYGQRMLARSSVLTAALCKAFDVPVRRATVDDLVNSEIGAFPWKGGVVGHIDCTLAAQRLGRPNHGHWDPGPGFPWDHYLGMVAAVLYNDIGDDEMAYTLEQLKLVATAGAIEALESDKGQEAIRQALKPAKADAAPPATASTSAPKPAKAPAKKK